jgi:hypothetical protein
LNWQVELSEEEVFSTTTRLKCRYLRASLLLRTWLRCGYRHKAEINPFRVVWLDPKIITHAYGAVVPRNCRFLSIVLVGDWDSPEHLVDEIPQFQMLYEHFKLGLPWLETARVKDALNNLEKTGTCWDDCHSQADILVRCTSFEELFTSIKKGGYQVPFGIDYGKTGITKACIPQEIVVNVTRDGRFLFWDGIHRLAIARILDLPLVPVRVLARQKLWQQVRDQVAVHRKDMCYPEIVYPYLSHPDIAFLMS